MILRLGLVLVLIIASTMLKIQVVKGNRNNCINFRESRLPSKMLSGITKSINNDTGVSSLKRHINP